MKYVINIDLDNPISEGVYADIDTGATWILTERMTQKLTPLEDVLIRCKDCRRWHKNKCLCDVWDEYISNEDFYCGCAERRTDESD